MADAKEVLELMRNVARSRLDMLNNGVTFYDEGKKAFYAGEYRKKLDEIDRLIRRFSLKLVHSKEKESDRPES
ncbi:hypothetical protein [Geobacter sp. DSM 9736]|uniref:hypothetical protein n=1 Tax=Geobacter sp. DSM 9736 TaxID=1277350 RepID=UPI000B50261B|nr:hypothetical protein [Geobacter sp. DSM 9736]SNB45725.1 hypothetical protein SAMN06269301_1153 [Geobacter sp. DSM 9736]